MGGSGRGGGGKGNILGFNPFSGIGERLGTGDGEKSFGLTDD